MGSVRFLSRAADYFRSETARAARTIGQAETPTMMTKQSASIRYSRLLSVAKKPRLR